MLDYEKFQRVHDFFCQGKSDLALRLLMQIQAQHITLHDTIDVLESRIQEFEDILFLSKALYFDSNFYWIRTSSATQGPFCPHCYEGGGMLFRLRMQENALYCGHCEATYEYGAHAVGDTSHHMPQAKLIPFKPKTF